jgi:uncharacterized protein DUF5677
MAEEMLPNPKGKPQPPPIPIGFGDPGFRKRNKRFLDRYDVLGKAQELAFSPRETQGEGPPDGIVFFLGRTCVDDFKEILLLCSNGFGFGAATILRGMFERVVTMKYLRTHPEACQDFLDFNDLNRLKFFRRVRTVHGEKVVPTEEVAALEARGQALREKFTIACPKCGALRPGYTWSKLDFMSMAEAVGMGQYVPTCYSMPLFHSHGSAQSFIARLRERSSGGIGYRAEPDTDQADGVLCSAHRLLLEVLLIQRNHFGIKELDAILSECERDLAETWGLVPCE